MYDNHISPRKYNSLKNKVINIMNNDNVKTDINKLITEIENAYSEGELSGSQYDNLMGYIQDFY